MEETSVREGLHILGYLGLSCLIRLVMISRGSRTHDWVGRVVGRVTHITIYPVKSTRGIDVDTVLCTTAGVRLTDTTVDIRDR